MKYNIYFAKDANFNIGMKMITVSNVSDKEAAEIAETMKKAYGLRFHMILVAQIRGGQNHDVFRIFRNFR